MDLKSENQNSSTGFLSPFLCSLLAPLSLSINRLRGLVEYCVSFALSWLLKHDPPPVFPLPDFAHC